HLSDDARRAVQARAARGAGAVLRGRGLRAVPLPPPGATLGRRRSAVAQSGRAALEGGGVTLSAPAIRTRKRRRGDAPLVMVTAYDEPSARFVDAAGVDLILVGDSVANVVLGHADTLHVTLGAMCH